MKSYLLILFSLVIISLVACSDQPKPSQSPDIIGTWKLISGTTIKGTDTMTTDYTINQEMIKIINDSHFAFLRHDLNGGKDSTAIYVAGGGRYTVDGNIYTEHLDYLNYQGMGRE